MAVLEKIRERTVLLLIMIGLGMFGFLFMGSEQGSWLGCNSEDSKIVAKISGEEINQIEYDNLYNRISSSFEAKGAPLGNGYFNYYWTTEIDEGDTTLVQIFYKKAEYDPRTGNPLKGYDPLYVDSAKNTIVYGKILGAGKVDNEILHNRSWEILLRDRIINEGKCRDLGIEVGSDEINQMLSVEGNSIVESTVLKRWLINSETGTFNKNDQAVQSIKLLINKDDLSSQETQAVQAYHLVALKEEMINTRLEEKLAALIENSLYVTKQESNNFNSTNKKVRYIAIPYNIKVKSPSLKEMQKYYKEHIKEYAIEHDGRSIEYAFIEETPSKDDIKRALVKKVSIDPSSYVFYSKKELEDPNREGYNSQLLDLQSSSLGNSVGPYEIDGGRYRRAKLVDTLRMANRMKIRFFQIPLNEFDQIPESKLAFDTLKYKVENNREDFEKTAISLFPSYEIKSKLFDQVILSTGNIDENAVVFEDDFLRKCFSAKNGQVKRYRNDKFQYFVHIVQLQDIVKKYKISFYDQEIKISEKTHKMYTTKAKHLIKDLKKGKEDFSSIAEQKGFFIGDVKDIPINQFNIAALDPDNSSEDDRKIIKWAYKSNVGDISNDVYIFGNKKVIVRLLAKRSKGIPRSGTKEFNDLFEEVKFEIAQKLMRNKQFRIISQKIGVSKVSLEDVLLKFDNLQIDTLDKVNLSQSQLSIGFEPSFIGVVDAVDVGDVSRPFMGKTSVFLVEVISENTEEKKSINMHRLKMQKIRKKDVFLNYISKMINNQVKIEDNRLDIYSP